ncbi:hypothetical protein [Clostridium sp. B9]|uniref:hypothetical protein n=1 Tax=Clostridium sp. B9 TaxID=3423224 RepID=UPI003D2EF61E
MKKLILSFLIGITIFNVGCTSNIEKVPEESNTQQVNPAQGVSPDPTEIPEEKNSKEEYSKNRIKGLYEKLVDKAESEKDFNEKEWSNFKGVYMNDLTKAEEEIKGTDSAKNIPLLKDLVNEYDKYLNGNAKDEKVKEIKDNIESNIK